MPGPTLTFAPAERKPPRLQPRHLGAQGQHPPALSSPSAVQLIQASFVVGTSRPGAVSLTPSSRPGDLASFLSPCPLGLCAVQKSGASREAEFLQFPALASLLADLAGFPPAGRSPVCPQSFERWNYWHMDSRVEGPKRCSTPGGTRTHNPCLRRPVPYPLGHWGLRLTFMTSLPLVGGPFPGLAKHGLARQTPRDAVPGTRRSETSDAHGNPRGRNMVESELPPPVSRTGKHTSAGRPALILPGHLRLWMAGEG